MPLSTRHAAIGLTNDPGQAWCIEAYKRGSMSHGAHNMPSDGMLGHDITGHCMSSRGQTRHGFSGYGLTGDGMSSHGMSNGGMHVLERL